MKKIKSLSEIGITKSSRILIVFPHPDDETFFTAGFIQKSLAIGANVKLIILTKGEASTLRFGLSDDENLGIVREKELIEAMKILGIFNPTIANFVDSKIENQVYEVFKYIQDQVNEFNPDFLVTFEPSGVYGHPDHIAVSKIISDIAVKNNVVIIYATVPKTYKPSKDSLSMAKNPEACIPLEPTIYFDLSLNEFFKKIKALSINKSQFSPTKNIISSIKHLVLAKKEYFVV